MKRIRQLRSRWAAGADDPAVCVSDADGSALLVHSVADPAAFESLVRVHSTALHGYLARRAPEAADDLLAEVWLRAFAGRAGFDPRRGTARTWLFGVSRHVLAAHRRIADAGRKPTSWGPNDDDAADPWQAVDERLDAEAVAPLIRRTLENLPHVERELLLLVVWEQMTTAEAARVLGVPPGTARSRLHRARTALRDALTPPVSFHHDTTRSLPNAITATATGESA